MKQHYIFDRVLDWIIFPSYEIYTIFIITIIHQLIFGLNILNIFLCITFLITCDYICFLLKKIRISISINKINSYRKLELIKLWERPRNDDECRLIQLIPGSELSWLNENTNIETGYILDNIKEELLIEIRDEKLNKILSYNN